MRGALGVSCPAEGGCTGRGMERGVGILGECKPVECVGMEGEPRKGVPKLLGAAPQVEGLCKEEARSR